MLLIVGPTQTRRQFHVFEDVIISFAKGGVRIQSVRILAQEIIVPLAIQAGDRIGIDIGASTGRSGVVWREGIDGREATRQTLAVVRNTEDPLPLH